MNKRHGDKLTTNTNIKRPWHHSSLVNVGYIWPLPPGRFGSGEISSRYFAIGAKNTNLAGQSGIGVLVVGLSQIGALKHMSCLSLDRGGFRGCAPSTPPLFFAEIARLTPDFVLAPQAKRMHQIVQINFENYKFCPLLRGHIPLRHPLSRQKPKFCQSLIWAAPL